MNGPRITIIGGGSMQWSPNLITDVLLREELDGAIITLHDIDSDAAVMVSLYGRDVARELDSQAQFRVETDLKCAIDGAQYIIIVISTGGLDAMSRDLSIPEDYGIYHTVGDSCGPGGWSRFIRNFPIFVQLAHAIRRYAPSAVVLNYTNPLTTLTGVLAREIENPVIGLCHGLFDNLEFLQQQYGVDESQIAMVYGGLNHFFWMTEISIGSLDVIADLQSRLSEGRTLTTLEEQKNAAPFHPGPFHSAHDLATELFQLTGALPFMEDRHTSEFLPWAITDPTRMQRQRLVRTTIEDRRRNQAGWVAEVEAAIQDGIPASRLESSREGAAEIISAHYANGVYIDVGNVPNRGQISNLPVGLVVETAVRTDRNGFTALTFGALPPVVAGLVAGPATAYDLLIDACFAADQSAAIQALRLEPSTSHLSTQQVNEMGERLLDANGGFPQTGG